VIANPGAPTRALEDQADVVVVGTGAGGGALAGELAGGRSVVLVEEGNYLDPAEYNGDPLDMTIRLYRSAGMTAAVGRPGIALPLGCTVGGTTVINSGTCHPPPPETLARWRDQFGVRAADLTPDGLAPYVARVEAVLNVSAVPEEYLGESARIFRRGIDALGMHGAPLKRAQRNCRGTGLCCFGCPRNAKQTTLLTYLPRAVHAGARLYANCRVDRLLLQEGRAVGVSGQLLHPETRQPTGHRLEVRARVVVMSAGAIGTPATLLRAGVRAQSGRLGRGLSMHPATKVLAEMPEPVDGFHGVPQSFYVDEWFKDGIVFEGIFVPPAIAALALPGFGRAHQDQLARYRHIASFGMFVIDDSVGKVKVDPFGDPLVLYDLSRADTARAHRGLALLCRAFLAAGAKTVIPVVHGFPILRSQAELSAFEAARVRAVDLELMGFHPMGTARMGPDPKTAVVDEDLASHDVPGLYVCDASVFPSALGVNPQETIMTLATRLADHLRARDEYFRPARA
jgi:choline dehydrogenase-like flavoprotein